MAADAYLLESGGTDNYLLEDGSGVLLLEAITARANTAEGGTDNVTVTTGNSGGASGDAWDVISLVAGTLTYENAPTLKGGLAYFSNKTVAEGLNTLSWTNSMGSGGRCFFRGYFLWDTLPSANSYFLDFYNSGTFLCGALFTTAGKILFVDQNGVQLALSSNTYHDNKVYRIEVKVERGSDAWEIRIHSGDYVGAMETFSGTGADLGNVNITSARVGASHATAGTFTHAMYFDNIAVAPDDWIGPSASGGGPIVVTHRGGIADTNSGSALTITSSPTWTPAANSLLLAWIEASTEDVSPTSVTGHGLTYTQMGRITMGSGPTTAVLELWAAKAGASPTSVAVSATWAAARSGVNISEEEVTGHDDALTLAVGAGNIFPQLVTATSGATTTDTSGTITLAAATTTGNLPVSAFIHQNNVAITHRTNWAELYDANYTTPARSMETQWRSDTFETTASASWTPAERWSGIAVEITVAPAVATAMPKETIVQQAVIRASYW